MTIIDTHLYFTCVVRIVLQVTCVIYDFLLYALCIYVNTKPEGLHTGRVYLNDLM